VTSTSPSGSAEESLGELALFFFFHVRQSVGGGGAPQVDFADRVARSVLAVLDRTRSISTRRLS